MTSKDRPNTPGAPPQRARQNSTIRGTYGLDNRCRACREHLADPHAPQCPLGIAERRREEAEDAAEQSGTDLTGRVDQWHA